MYLSITCRWIMKWFIQLHFISIYSMVEKGLTDHFVKLDFNDWMEAKCFLIQTCVVFFHIQHSMKSLNVKMVNALVCFGLCGSSNRITCYFGLLKCKLYIFFFAANRFWLSIFINQMETIERERKRFCKSFFHFNNSSCSFILNDIARTLPLLKWHELSPPINYHRLARHIHFYYRTTKLIALKWEMFIH